MLDFINPSLASVGTENHITGTPYQKNKKHPFSFENGFYEFQGRQTTHPIQELIKSKIFKVLFKWFESKKLFPDSIQRSSAFSEPIGLLLKNNCEKVSFEKTPDESLLIKAEMYGRNMYLEIFFDEEETKGYEAVLNLYEAQNHLFTKVGTIEDIEKVISAYFTKQLSV